MFKRSVLVLPLLLASAAMPQLAVADIVVKFTESAPKDSFTIVNTGQCPLGAMTFRFDLAASQAGLIFDTAASGAGVQVYQPFELVRGAEFVDSISAVRDGDTMIDVSIFAMDPRGHITFTIDIDDTQSDSPEGPTMISEAEIQGAVFIASSDYGFGGEGVFNHFGVASIKADCVM